MASMIELDNAEWAFVEDLFYGPPYVEVSGQVAG